MRVTYDEEADVLYFYYPDCIQGAAEVFRRGPDVAVFPDLPHGYGITAVEVLGGSAYLPLGNGYDADLDILTIGETTDDPALISENGDFVGYWEIDEDDPEGARDSIGVAIRRASIHMAQVSASFEE